MLTAAELTHLGTKRTSQKFCRASPARASIHHEALTLRRSFFRHFTVHMSWSFLRNSTGVLVNEFLRLLSGSRCMRSGWEHWNHNASDAVGNETQIRPVLYLWYGTALCTVYAHLISSAVIDHASPLWPSRTGQIENSKRRRHASLSSNRNFSCKATGPG